MSDSQYSRPVVVDPDGNVTPLSRMRLAPGGEDATCSEEWLRDLLFQYPSALPVEEIDSAYRCNVPICRELSTSAGFIDALYATPEGKLIVLETKLWRNPEARRKVVGQILDYAKALSLWTYEDLQREVSRATKTPGNALYERVKAQYPDTDEARFVDQVSRSLRTGDFLLLIVGDGIREGVGGIAEFLDRAGYLRFGFGLIEIAIHRLPQGSLLLQPRVIAKTTTIQRWVVTLDSPELSIRSVAELEASADLGPNELEQFYMDFWTELLSELRLDDVAQPLANATKMGNIFFSLPSNGNAWITVYFVQQQKEVGVFLRLSKGDLNQRVYDSIRAERETVEEEMGEALDWRNDRKVLASRRFPDLRSPRYRGEIKAFLTDHINKFVNAFRGRVAKRYEEALGG